MGKPLKNQLIRYLNVTWLVGVKFYSFLPLGEPKKSGVVILDKELGGINVPKAVLFDLGDTLIVEQAGKHLGKTPFDAIPQTRKRSLRQNRRGSRSASSPTPPFHERRMCAKLCSSWALRTILISL